MISVYNSVLAQPALAQGALLTGVHAGPAVDTGLFGNMFRSIQFIINVQAITDGTHVVSVQECATFAGTYTAIDALRTQGALPTLGVAQSNTLVAVGVHHTLRYVQLVITSAGTTTGGLFSAVALGGTGGKGPVARA